MEIDEAALANASRTFLSMKDSNRLFSDAFRAAILAYESSRSQSLDARDAVIEECAKVVWPWRAAAHVRLHAGEMTASEMRSVLSVVNSIYASIRALKRPADRKGGQ